MNIDELKRRLTDAILIAEDADRHAATAWARVARLENEFFQHPDASELEKLIGRRGHAYARMKELQRRYPEFVHAVEDAKAREPNLGEEFRLESSLSGSLANRREDK